MIRTTKHTGTVVIVGAVSPVSGFLPPVANLARRLDRGIHVRTEDEHRQFLGGGWEDGRPLMAYSGLEVTMATRRRAGSSADRPAAPSYD